MRILISILSGTAALVFALGGGTAFAATAGQVLFVSGSAQATNEAGKVRQLRRGDSVSEGDTLTTAPAAAVQLRLQDGGVVAIRPDSRLKIESYKFSGKADGSESSVLSLLRGGFRTITGLIGHVHRPSYRVITPTATIGIRGTDHEVFVVVPGSALAATVPAGAYDKVNTGETYMSNDHGEVAILPNQMGFAAAGQAPLLQPLNLNLFTVPPAPPAGGGKSGESMRDNAVVDGVLQGQVPVPGFLLPPTFTFTPAPITATYPCTIMLVTGQPVPATCSATF